MEGEKEPSTQLKVRAIVCAMMVNFLVGSFYAISNLNPYIASWLGKKPEDTIITMQIWIFFQSIFAILGVKVAEKIGPWLTNYIGFAGFSLLQIVASWSKNYVGFLFVYGVLCGSFVGLGYVQALYISWTYFPKKKSMATGLILLWVGLSASILAPLTTSIANPNNLPKDHPEYGSKVPTVFRIYAIIYGTLTFLGCTFQPRPWQSEHLKEHQEAKKTLKSGEFTDDFHKQAVLATLKRTLACPDGRSTFMNDISTNQVSSIHKHDLMKDLHWAGGGEHGMLISKDMEQAKIADLVFWKMKYHQILDTHHNHLNHWKKKDPTHIVHAHSAAEGLEEMEMAHHHRRDNRLRTVYECHYDAVKNKIKELGIDNEPLDTKEALMSRHFWLLALMALGSSIYNYSLTSNWKDFYLNSLAGVKDSKLSVLVTYGSIGSCTMRILFGFLLLKLKLKHMYWVLIGLTMFCSFTFKGLMKSYGAGVFYIVAAFSSIGMQFIIFPTACTMIFGSRIGPKIFPYVFLVFSISNFAQYFTYKFYAKKSSKPEIMFYIFGGLAVLGLLASFVIDLQPNWNAQRNNKIINSNTVQSKPGNEETAVKNNREKVAVNGEGAVLDTDKDGLIDKETDNHEPHANLNGENKPQVIIPSLEESKINGEASILKKDRE